MAPLDESMTRIRTAVEKLYFFRKLGLPFDYRSTLDDFPSRAFATPKETRAGLPTPTGVPSSGLGSMCTNHSLLLDACLLRMELGIDSPSDEMLLDRLIGGLIRLATIGPKSFLIGGLTADGRGFYGTPRIENHAAWAFSAWRGMTTSVIAPQSQEKFHSIGQKWANRLRRENWELHTVDGKPVPNGILTTPDADKGPVLLAILQTAALAEGRPEIPEAYISAANENSGSRIGPFPVQDGESCLPALLWRQMCLSLLAETDPERKPEIQAALTANARFAAQFIDLWRKWEAPAPDAPTDPEWRSLPQTPEAYPGFEPSPTWQRMLNESTLSKGLEAMLILLLAADAELAKPYVEEMTAALESIQPDTILTLEPLALAQSVHARGAALELWEAAICNGLLGPDPSASTLAAKFMTPDYDDLNPDKAGHTAPPTEKHDSEGSHRHKRRHHKKKRKNHE